VEVIALRQIYRRREAMTITKLLAAGLTFALFLSHRIGYTSAGG